MSGQAARVCGEVSWVRARVRARVRVRVRVRVRARDRVRPRARARARARVRVMLCTTEIPALFPPKNKVKLLA